MDVQDFRKNNPSFLRNFEEYISINGNPERCPHCNRSWTWKHSDLDRVCPKIFPDTGMRDVASSRNLHPIALKFRILSRRASVAREFKQFETAISKVQFSSQFLRPVNSVCVNRTFDKK